MSHRSVADDTSINVHIAMAAAYARMSPAEKLRRVRDLTAAASAFALAGLRQRHPEESESDLLLRLARIRLGDHVVDAAYQTRARRRGT
jgi:hypothetical protein